jgi:SAM-dependent methyltransferase
MNSVFDKGGLPHRAATFGSAMESAHAYNRWIVRAFRPYVGREVLEVGIGHGGFRALLATPGYVGADIDAELVLHARTVVPNVDLVVADVSASGFGEALGGRRFDTVLCVNVLEHVREQEAGLANMMAALDPGGHLLLFVPAFNALYNDLDRLAGHVRRYRNAEVRQLLVEAGAHVVTSEYFNAVGGMGWWANRFVSHETLESGSVEGQVRFFDRWVLPISRAINPVTRHFFGQSVIAVARKSSSTRGQ